MLFPLLLLLIGLLGFLTVLIILTRYKTNRMVNIYLIILIIITSSRFFLIGLNSLSVFKSLNGLLSSYNQFFILVVPSLYLYTQNLIRNRKSFLLQDLKHFILPIIFSVSITKIDGHISALSPHWKITLLLFLVAFFTYYIYNLFKLVLSQTSTKTDFINSKKKESQQIRYWCLFLLILSSLCLLRVSASIYLQLFDENNYLITYHGYIWISSLIWMIIFLKILISPRILYGYATLNNIVKEEKISGFEFKNIWNIPSKKEIKNLQDIKLKPQIDINIIEYISAIERVSIEFAPFQNFQFSTSDLAIKIKIPTSHLNYIFKYHSKLSFSDFKKNVRIHQSVALIQSKYLQTNTLESLAKEVGFGSYNPFFSSFKSIIGQSPKEYIEQLNA